MMKRKPKEEKGMGRGHLWQIHQFTEETEPQKEEVSREMLLVRNTKWISRVWT